MWNSFGSTPKGWMKISSRPIPNQMWCMWLLRIHYGILNRWVELTMSSCHCAKLSLCTSGLERSDLAFQGLNNLEIWVAILWARSLPCSGFHFQKIIKIKNKNHVAVGIWAQVSTVFATYLGKSFYHNCFERFHCSIGLWMVSDSLMVLNHKFMGEGSYSYLYEMHTMITS